MLVPLTVAVCERLYQTLTTVKASGVVLSLVYNVMAVVVWMIEHSLNWLVIHPDYVIPAMRLFTNLRLMNIVIQTVTTIDELDTVWVNDSIIPISMLNRRQETFPSSGSLLDLKSWGLITSEIVGVVFPIILQLIITLGYIPPIRRIHES